MDNILVMVDSMVVILSMGGIHSMVDLPMVTGIAHMVTGIAHMVVMLGMDRTMAETRMTQGEDQPG
jgi:hypothetical protein